MLAAQRSITDFRAIRVRVMGVRILFTIIFVASMVHVAFLPDGVDLAGPDRKWCGGRKDLVRNLIHREDGSLRRYSRQGIIAFHVVLLVLNWILTK